jgi:hypothetical protein
VSDTDPATPVVKKKTTIKRTPKPGVNKTTPVTVVPKTTADAVVESPVEVKPKPKKRRKPIKGLDAHGFREGSDSSIIVAIMLKGGIDRQDINEKVAAAIDPLTKSGRRKNIPSLISGLLGRLEDKGYYPQAEWKLIPPKKKR